MSAPAGAITVTAATDTLPTAARNLDGAQIGQPVPRYTLNNGQLVLEGIPAIPTGLPQRFERFRHMRRSSMLAWSADGRTVYLRSRAGGVNQVQALDGPRSEPRPLTAFDEPVREVVRQHNGELLAFTLNDGGSANDQIWLLDPADGSTRQLTDTTTALNNRVVWDQAGQRLAFRSTRRNGRSNDIWLLDIDAPEQARLLLPVEDGALWKPVSFSRDGRLLLLQQYQGITDSRIYLLDVADGALRELVGHPEFDTSNVAIDFDGEDRGVFFVSNQRGRSAEIGWVPLAEGEATRWVENTISWDVTSFELAPDGRRGAFLTNENGISQLYLFDAKRFNYRKVRGLPIGVLGDLRFSPDGRRLGLTASTPTSPGDVYVLPISRLWDRPKRWGKTPEGAPDPDTLVTPSLFTFPAPGLQPGQTFYIPGFKYLPGGPGPHPVVIYIHGGPESQFRPNFKATVQLWASELGVAVLAPNVRGSLGYGRTYLSLDDGMRREDAVRDIGYLLDWIETQDDLDASRVAVFGASYGGYMALASAVHYSDRLAAAVNRAGISNFVTYLENTSDFRRDLRRFEYGDERDPEMRAFLQSISPLNNVEQIRVPVLIVQGENDPVVPASESAQMVRALRDQGETVWYLNALNEGHSYDKQENRDVFQQVTYLFLRRFLLEGSDTQGP